MGRWPRHRSAWNNGFSVREHVAGNVWKLEARIGYHRMAAHRANSTSYTISVDPAAVMARIRATLPAADPTRSLLLRVGPWMTTSGPSSHLRR